MSTAHDDAVDRAGAPTEALALPTVEPTKARLAKMFETIENIGKAEDHLQRKIDAELATAEKFDAAGKTREALQCIEKKEMYEQQLATLGMSRIDLENQKLTLESMKMNAEILDALRVAAKSIQRMVATSATRRTFVLERGPQGLGLELDSTNSIITVKPGGRAEQQALVQLDDIILSVDGKSLAGKLMQEVMVPGRPVYVVEILRPEKKEVPVATPMKAINAIRRSKQIKEMGGVDKVEELMDEVEDVHTRGVSILSELISGMISELIMLDGELQCLEKKEKYEQRLTTLGTSKIILEYQKMILEKHAVHEHELNDFAALREAKKAMQKQGQSSLLGILRGWVKKIGGVDEVEELMDQREELIDECLKALLMPISDLMLHGIDADDDELLAELDRLMKEELAADLSMVDLGIAVEIPSAQKRGGKAGFLKQLRKRVMGVALPMMSQRAIINVVGSATDSKRTSLLSDQDNVLPVLKDEERELAELRAAVAG